jgi:hypothetical protein
MYREYAGLFLTTLSTNYDKLYLDEQESARLSVSSLLQYSYYRISQKAMRQPLFPKIKNSVCFSFILIQTNFDLVCRKKYLTPAI